MRTIQKIAIAAVILAAAPLATAIGSDIARDTRIWAKLDGKPISQDIIAAEHERAYKDICPMYFEQSYIRRMITKVNYGWCEDYKDRL